MAEDPGGYLTSHVGEDLKKTIEIVGFDLTGVTGICRISLMKNTPPLITPAATFGGATEDEDGVPISLFQIFAAKATVHAAIEAIDGLEPGEDTTLFLEFRVSSLPGDTGTAAVTTLIACPIIFKGSVDD